MMKVISCFDEIVDGAIGAVTYKVEENGCIIQEATVEIVDDGKKALLKSNKIFVDNESKIKESFIAVIETLKSNGVNGVYVVDTAGNLKLLKCF